MSTKSSKRRKRNRQHHSDTSTSTNTSTSSSASTATSTPPSTFTAPTSSVPATVPAVDITSSSSFRETIHALISHYLPPVLSNIIIELLEDQWQGWMPIHGVSCDLFLPFSTDSSFEHATSHHGQHYDISHSSLISPDVSHIRYHLFPPTYTPVRFGLTIDANYWGCGTNRAIYEYDPDEPYRYIDWCGNITWKHMDGDGKIHDTHQTSTSTSTSTSTPTSTRKKRRRSTFGSTSKQRRKQQQQTQQQQQKEYEMKRDRIMHEMNDEERLIVNHLHTSSPYPWSQFRDSLPTTATLAHILSRPWSAWRKVEYRSHTQSPLISYIRISDTDDENDEDDSDAPIVCRRTSHHLTVCRVSSFQLISPHEWIEISCLYDSKEAGDHGFRLEYQPRDTSPSPHPIMADMINPMEHLHLCVRLM